MRLTAVSRFQEFQAINVNMITTTAHNVAIMDFRTTLTETRLSMALPRDISTYLRCLHSVFGDLVMPRHCRRADKGRRHNRETAGMLEFLPFRIGGQRRLDATARRAP